MRNTWSTINEILNKNKVKQAFPSYFIHNGKRLDNPQVIADEFNKYFTDVGLTLASKIDFPKNICYEDYLQNPVQDHFKFRSVTIETVIKTIESLKPKARKGADNISNKILKYIKYEIASILSKFMNMIFEQGIFPDILKIAKVIPIHKKNDNHCFENYRPISILPSVSKVFERIIHDQIYQYFTTSKLFYTSQYGFRTLHSTEFATLELLDRIILYMDKNKQPINIYMDLSKAFDTLDHTILLKKLKHYGIRDKSLDLLTSYLNNRIQYVNYGDIFSYHSIIKCGVPQGSILGPLLFIIYVNDIVNATQKFKPLLYADDTTLFTNINSDFTNDPEILNNELQSISDWLKVNKLSLNVEKTKAILFHTPQKKIQHPELFINGIKIEFVDRFNFLGIVIDKHLKWTHHIEAISKKISRTLGIMTKIKQQLPLNALLNIYNALILPHLNYGLMIWGWKSKKLTSLQKRAVRIITKSHYRAHTTELFRKLNMLKIKDLCALQDYKFCFKFENSLLPHYFTNEMKKNLENKTHRYVTRHINNIKLPAVRHEFARHSISYTCPKTLNNMPSIFKEIINTHSFHGFKLYVKNKTVEAYIDDCNIPNCYSCQFNRPTNQNYFS